MLDPARLAFLVVDVQNDFCAGGVLAVPGGDAIVPVVNYLARALAARGALVLASRDWHPRQSRHFSTHGGPWPVHCVAGTPGAQFHPGLDLPASTLVVTKGDTPEADGYSAFEGHVPSGALLADALRAHDVRALAVAGLATDYCVRHSALDGCRSGFDVMIVEDAVRGIDAEPGDSARAVAEIVAAGGSTVTSKQLLSQLA